MTSLDGLLEYLESLNSMNQPITVERIIIALLVTLASALMIYGFYKLTFKGALYTKNFNVGLVMTALVTALIILPISSNLLLSLGMVGALSIVRFRTAIKDPMDTVFMFWAIAVGLSCGAGIYLVPVLGSPLIGVTILGFSYATRIPGKEPYLLVTHYSIEVDEEVTSSLPSRKVRSRTVSDKGVELIVEVRLSEKETRSVDRLMNIKGVKDAALVGYNGDVAS